MLVCGLALLVLWLVWPHTHLYGSFSEIESWKKVAVVALANSVAAITAYLGGGRAGLGLRRCRHGATAQSGANSTRRRRRGALGASLICPTSMSSANVMARRIESGRSGPRGNERLKRLLKQLEAIDAKDPLDTILITGDMTDAGISTEWAELLDALAAHPSFAGRVLMLPGNHDLNIVDRANPARMDLPTSPNRPLRQIGCLSAMNAVQGRHVRVIDRTEDCLGGTLEEALRPHRGGLGALCRYRAADPLKGDPRSLGPSLSHGRASRQEGRARHHSAELERRHAFLLHQCARHGVGRADARRRDRARPNIREACWVIALHHHVVEYPWAAKALSERIGTRSDQRQLVRAQPEAFVGPRRPDARPPAYRLDRPIAGLPIISAPSPVMEVTDDMDTAFYIHSLAIDADGKLRLLEPERIVVPGESIE